MKSQTESLLAGVLESNRIYTSSELESKGFKLARIYANREISEASVKQKMQSIIKTRGIIASMLLVPGQICFKEGLKIYLIDGDEIDENYPDLDKVLVILDGQTRTEALSRLNANLKDGEEPYQGQYYLPLQESTVALALQQANQVVKTWSGSDFLSSTIIGRTKSNDDLEKLKWVKQVSQSASFQASWLWAGLSDSRVPSKTKFIKAADNDVIFAEIAESSKFEYGKSIYECLCGKFSDAWVGRKVVPLFFISKFDEMILGKSDATTAVVKLCDFIDSLSEDSIKVLEGMKADKNGASKDSKITTKLEQLYTGFSKS